MKRGLIDFIKLSLIKIDVSRLLANSNLEFNCDINTTTGQICDEKMVATYHTCKITIITQTKSVVVNGKITSKIVQHIMFAGSIHKLWNSLNSIKAPNHLPENIDRGFNGNEFTLEEVIAVREHLEELFGCTSKQMIFQNIEIGANLAIGFDPMLFLKWLLYHNNKLFDYMHGRNSAQVKHSRYILKIYNKSFQYGMLEHVLRVELKYLKMHDLKPLGIVTFADVGEETLQKAHLLLVEKFDEVMAYDDTIRKEELSHRELLMLPKYSNANYWISDLRPNRRHRHKVALKQIINKHSDNRQFQIRKLLAKECVINNRGTGNAYCVINNTSIIGLESTQKDLWNEGKETVETNRICPITGLDISMQKDSSYLLGYSGLHYYLQHQPDVFKRIKQLYLTAYWSEAELKTQIKEIAHNIRTLKKNQVRKQRRIYPEGQVQLFDI
ncbi:hypothetical protein [Flavobacterium sp.]|uniref:hypothetical protein n=1 Tax=Flavobacterium sp. TaxID=239 RepID=UPI0040332D49